MPVASALGLGLLAGGRLYATAFGIGLLLRFNWVALPAAWQHASVLADPRVLIVSGVACAIEFIADKIPWVDVTWDSIHMFIRPIGAALLTSSLFSSLDPAHQIVLFLLAGGVALSGHAAKATTRLAVNHSPEPFSNVTVSLAEDAAVAVGLYMLVKHPWVMAGIGPGFPSAIHMARSADLPCRPRGVDDVWGAAVGLVRKESQTATPPCGATMAGGSLERPRAASVVRCDRHSRP